MRLYNAFVLPYLLYNLGTQGFSQTQEEKLDTFHRKQIKKVFRVFYPHRISNVELYKRANTDPLSQIARKARWELLGQILRLPDAAPAQKAIKAYFIANETMPKRRGAPRNCLVSTLQRDLSNQKIRKIKFESLSDAVQLQGMANNREEWKKRIVGKM
jgi:hypothetical protein